MKITKLIFFILGTLCAFNNAIFGQNLKVNKQLLSAPNKHYKYGLIDTETNTVWIKPVYDDLYFIGDSSLVQAKKVDKYGIIDLNGMEIIPFEYEMIISFDGEIFKVQKNGNWGVLNRKNEIEIPINYQYVILENEEYLILRKNDLLGICKPNHEFVTSIIYDKIERYKNYFIVVYKGGYGVLDKNGKELIEPNYTKISPIFKNHVLIEQQQKSALVSLLIPSQINFKYDYVGKGFKGKFAAGYDSKHGIIDSLEKEIIPIHFDKEFNPKALLYQADSAGFIGFFNQKGERRTEVKYLSPPKLIYDYFYLEDSQNKVLVDLWDRMKEPFIYPEIYVIDSALAVVKEAEYTWSARHIRTNQRIIDKYYRYISPFSNGLAYVRYEGFLALINLKFEMITPAKYTYFDFNSSEYIIASIGNKKGALNYAGKEIIPIKYETIYKNNEGFFEGRTKFRRKDLYNQKGEPVFVGKYKYIISIGNFEYMVGNRKLTKVDTLGNHIFNFKCLGFRKINDDLMAVGKRKKYALVDRKGNFISEYKYDYVNPLNKEVSATKIDNKFGLINKLGKEITPISYEDIKLNEKGGLLVKLNNKFGIMNNYGNLVLPIEFESISKYNGNYAQVKKNGFYGHINSQGHLLYEAKYEEVNDFRFGFAKVKLNNKWTLINQNGKQMFEPIYDELTYSREREKLIDVKLNGKNGLAKTTGEIIIPCNYDLIHFDVQQNCVVVENKTNGSSKKGLFNISTGMEILPIKFNEIAFDGNRIKALINKNYQIYTFEGECLNCY